MKHKLWVAYQNGDPIPYLNKCLVELVKTLHEQEAICLKTDHLNIKRVTLSTTELEALLIKEDAANDDEILGGIRSRLPR